MVTGGGAAVHRARLAAPVAAGPDPVVIFERAGLGEPDPPLRGLALRRLGPDRAAGAWFVGDHPANHVRRAAATGAPWPKAPLPGR